MDLNPFERSEIPAARKHGPGGYLNYQEYKDWLRDEFYFRCVYCLEREQWYPSRSASYAVEHTLPQNQYPDLICQYDNLVYACARCNSLKQLNLVLDPSKVVMSEHIQIMEDGTIESASIEGEYFISIFHLNESPALDIRKMMLRFVELKRRFPDDVDLDLVFRSLFGFPDALPDLGAKRPPSNSRPEGTQRCFFRLRANGTLPESY